MTDKPSAWATFDGVWRSVFAAFWRLPLLVAGSMLLYVVLSAYWFHYVPIHVSGHIASQLGYILLHAVIFTPLVLAVMAMILDGRPDRSAIWTPAWLPVGAVLFVYEMSDLLLRQGVFALRQATYQQQALALYEHHHELLSALLFALPGWIAAFAFFALAVRLVLLLPVLARETAGRDALRRGWYTMRGNFKFALLVSILSALPFVAVDILILSLYHRFSLSSRVPGPLSLREWEAIFILSFELTLRFVFFAALAAWLYRVIVVRKPTAP